MSVQIRIMGDHNEVEAVWNDVEAALAAQGYDVSLGGSKANHGGDGYRFYGVVEQ